MSNSRDFQSQLIDGESHTTLTEATLADLRAGMRSASAHIAGESPGTLAHWLELMYEADELLEELGERDLVARLDVLARIHESIGELRNCMTPAELIEAAPSELCRSCGFSRALISRVQGSRWIPEVIETVPGMDPEATKLAENIEKLEIPLGNLPETELVRRRMAALISDPVADPLAFSGVALRGRTPPYVAAPIMPTGRVIGFLHADRIGQPNPVTPQDCDNLWTFATHFGLLYERAVLNERLAAQSKELHHAFASAEGAADDRRRRDIDLARGEQAAPEPPRTATTLFRPAESRLDGLLTRREREVLDLMTSGATNVRIAEQLVISEGTVKSHVKHILRKLRAANRAEAVARYLRILLREQEEAGRR